LLKFKQVQFPELGQDNCEFVMAAQDLDEIKMEFPSNEYCQVCDSEGALVMCDSCPKTYHKLCLRIPEYDSTKDWFCDMCKGIAP
jgi:hypothetical protein